MAGYGTRAADTRHSAGNVTRVHAILPGVLPELERLAEHPSVDRVIPSRIFRRRGAGGRRGQPVGWKIRPCLTGARLEVHTAGMFQEVWVVGRDQNSILDACRSILDKR